MENETITIEVKKETAFLILWITAGVTAVTIAFFLPERTSELWPSLNAAGVVAGIYLIALLIYVLRKPIRRRTRTLTIILVLIIGSGLVSSWNELYKQGPWQRQQLHSFRTSFGRYLITAKVPGPLYAVLEQYYKQGKVKQESLGKVFQRMYPNTRIGDNIYKPEFKWDSLKIYLHSLADNRIVMLACDHMAAGHDPQFKNIDGRVGKIQEQFVLTERGLTHDIQN